MDIVMQAIKPFFAALTAAVILTAFLPAYASNTKADEQTGAVLFRDKGCTFCHGVGGIGGKKAPSLVDIRKDANWPPAKITTQILNGGQKMPPFGDSLTDPQIAQLVAYLRAKNRPVPPPLPAQHPPPASSIAATNLFAWILDLTPAAVRRSRPSFQTPAGSAPLPPPVPSPCHNCQKASPSAGRPPPSACTPGSPG